MSVHDDAHELVRLAFAALAEVTDRWESEHPGQLARFTVAVAINPGSAEPGIDVGGNGGPALTRAMLTVALRGHDVARKAVDG